MAPTTMATTDTIVGWIGETVEANMGARVGRLEGVYVDAHDLSPVWLLVRTGVIRARHVLVPAAGAADAGGHVFLSLDRSVVVSAPEHNPHDDLTPYRERMLVTHYDILPTRGALQHGRDRQSACVLLHDTRELENVRAGRPPHVDAPKPEKRVEPGERYYAAAIANGTYEYPPGRVPPPRTRGTAF